jgi:hypothetical protein
MKKRPLSVLGLGLLASLTAANGVQSADASAHAGVTIVVSVNVSTSLTAVCDESISGHVNGQCHAPVILQVESDGRLIGPQGVSLTLTPEAEARNLLAATLAYN